MNLVNDDQASEFAERLPGGFQAGQIHRVFKVKIGL